MLQYYFILFPCRSLLKWSPLLTAGYQCMRLVHLWSKALGNFGPSWGGFTRDPNPLPCYSIIPSYSHADHYQNDHHCLLLATNVLFHPIPMQWWSNALGNCGPLCGGFTGDPNPLACYSVIPSYSHANHYYNERHWLMLVTIVLFHSIHHWLLLVPNVLFHHIPMQITIRVHVVTNDYCWSPCHNCNIVVQATSAVIPIHESPLGNGVWPGHHWLPLVTNVLFQPILVRAITVTILATASWELLATNPLFKPIPV